MENKREKFVRLAEKRMNTTLKTIDLLGNLANSNAYEFTEEDLNKIVSEIKSAVLDLEKVYSLTNKKRNFKL